jgi:hypothetical protein
VINGTEILQKNVINNIGSNNGSQTNSRIIYERLSNNIIVHEHPSRPSRSPSPISHNPQSNIIPQTNFIYNASGQMPSRVVSYTPPKLPRVV